MRLTFVLLLACFTAASIVALEPIPGKLVVLTFDDSVKSHFTIVRPILLKYNFGATFFITEGFDFTTNKDHYMTWNQIAQLHQAGFEIGNHTRDHMTLDVSNPAKLRRQLGQLSEQLTAINNRCRENGIPQTTSFAYPGNGIDDAAFAILKKEGIQFARRGGAPEYPYEQGRGFAFEPGLDHPLLIPSAGDARPDWEFDDFKRAADQAKLDRIAVLQFHGAPDDAHSWVSTPADRFEIYMRYLAANDFKVIAMRDLSQYVDPDVFPKDPRAIINDRKQGIIDGPAVKNPYYSDDDSPPWKLWFVDDAPVEYTASASGKESDQEKTKTRTLIPPGLSKRLYPDLSAKRSVDDQLFPFTTSEREPAVAGFWDDAVASLDHNHVRLKNRYQFGNQSVVFADQMIQVLHGSPRLMDRMKIGINFAWQSEARKGHHLFLNERMIRRMEQVFTFANCLYASPGWLSRTDVMPDRMVDSYDGLFGHYYNSLGQSGSELPAIAKMIYTGAHLPRSTKDLMKTHGVYPLAMLTIFKATLPYRDGVGNEVPFENELRHRPSYASDGNQVSDRYVSRELEYHLYDQDLHVRRMVQMARGMKSPPPVTLLRLIDVKQATQDNDSTGSSSFTSIRLHGKPGQSMEVSVDLSGSYDLAGRPLTFHAKRVYPQQANIDVKIDDQGMARIVATYNSKYPSGRFPVILWADNGTDCPGNPVFVNFHWPADGQVEKPAYYAPYRQPSMSEEDINKFTERGADRDQNVEVNRNDKPIIESSLDGTTVKATVGKPITFQLTGKDPEGFPTRLYQWSTDIGTINAGRFSYTPVDSDRGKTIPVRFICSDGTGGYRGLTVQIQVQ